MYHVKVNDLTKHLMHYRLLRGGGPFTTDIYCGKWNPESKL